MAFRIVFTKVDVLIFDINGFFLKKKKYIVKNAMFEFFNFFSMIP